MLTVQNMPSTRGSRPSMFEITSRPLTRTATVRVRVFCSNFTTRCRVPFQECPALSSVQRIRHETGLRAENQAVSGAGLLFVNCSHLRASRLSSGT